MRNIKLTKSERDIEESIEEFVPVSVEEYKEIVQAIAVRKKNAILSIRVNSDDLKSIKKKAQKLGLKYQTFISEVLHRVAQAW